jgi:mannitol-specific phosphotransferase system IIBC component
MGILLLELHRPDLHIFQLLTPQHALVLCDLLGPEPPARARRVAHVACVKQGRATIIIVVGFIVENQTRANKTQNQTRANKTQNQMRAHQTQYQTRANKTEKSNVDRVSRRSTTCSRIASIATTRH